jgi:hypothetical protein
MSDSLSPEVEEYVTNLNRQLENERSNRLNLQTQLGNISNFTGSVSKEQNIVEFQLEVDKELDKLYHLLSGHEIKTSYDGNGSKLEYWAEPEDDRLKSFSLYGVKKIMNLLSIYVSKLHMLGFYEEEVIRWKVRDFGIELTDFFLTGYESILYYPSPEELLEKYWPLVQKQGLKITEEELYQKCLLWSEDELSSRENVIPIICLSLIDLVHSVYTRAFLGKERTSLGERGINISQTQQGGEMLKNQMQNKGRFLSFGR